MKLNRFEKINFGSFKNFQTKTDLDDFTSINIVLGWNGSGKTTISRLLRSFETGELVDDPMFVFKIDSSRYTESSNLESFDNKIRVFNDDYVKKITTEDKNFPQIFYVGKESVDYSSEEQQLEKQKEELKNKKCINSHDQIAKDVSSVVSRVTGINGFSKELMVQSDYSSYTKIDFEKRIKDFESKSEGNDSFDISKYIQNDIVDIQTQLLNETKIKKTISIINSSISWIENNFESIKICLDRTPQQEISKRITVLSEEEKSWVKEGVDIHFSEDHKENCIFCNSKINNKDELLKHFSEEFLELTNEINKYLDDLNKNKEDLSDNENIGNEGHEIKAKEINKVIDILLKNLKTKKENITKKIEIEVDSVNFERESIDVDNNEIAYKIERHYVAEKYKKYQSFKKTYEECINSKKILEKSIEETEKKLKILKSRARNTHQAAEDLNEIFKVAFPYRKIEISDNENQTGYELRRNGSFCPFSSLSEGERNLIALAYFIKSLNDENAKFDSEGVVVIDDPVSSLDKNSIFQIFSIITKEIEINNDRQYVLLTHNLDFFGHLKENYQNKINKNKCNLYNIKLTESGSEIENIHKLLKNNRSDYYYVFSVLNQHKDNCNIENSYLMVNLLRRWLETFLNFKFPTDTDLRGRLKIAYKKTKEIYTDFNYDPNELYRFITYGSHGFSNTEEIDESILNGASQRINESLEMVKILDPMHFEKLESCIKQTNE